jgi:hypothetical protein
MRQDDDSIGEQEEFLQDDDEGDGGEVGFEGPEASLRFQDPAHLPPDRSPRSAYAAGASMDDMGDFGFDEP